MKLRYRDDRTPGAHRLDGMHEVPLQKETMRTCLFDVPYVDFPLYFLLAGSRFGWPGGSVYHRREVAR